MKHQHFNNTIKLINIFFHQPLRISFQFIQFPQNDRSFSSLSSDNNMSTPPMSTVTSVVTSKVGWPLPAGGRTVMTTGNLVWDQEGIFTILNQESTGTTTKKNIGTNYVDFIWEENGHLYVQLFWGGGLDVVFSGDCTDWCSFCVWLLCCCFYVSSSLLMLWWWWMNQWMPCPTSNSL